MVIFEDDEKGNIYCYERKIACYTNTHAIARYGEIICADRGRHASLSTSLDESFGGYLDMPTAMGINPSVNTNMNIEESVVAGVEVNEELKHGHGCGILLYLPVVYH